MRWTTMLLAIAAFALVGTLRAAAQDELLDCEDFDSQAEAQAYYRENPDDPTGNDADGDGIACELFEYEDTTTDYEPVTGAEDSTSTSTAETATVTVTSSSVTTLASTGTGTGSASATPGALTVALLVALLGLAAGCGGAAVRASRRA